MDPTACAARSGPAAAPPPPPIPFAAAAAASLTEDGNGSHDTVSAPPPPPPPPPPEDLTGEEGGSSSDDELSFEEIFAMAKRCGETFVRYWPNLTRYELILLAEGGFWEGLGGYRRFGSVWLDRHVLRPPPPS